LENVSGGTIIMPWMWWYIDSLAANGGVATETFEATLPCQGTVVNDDYLVVDSDQGVSSAVGAPVSVDVIAPTLNVGFDQSAVSALVSTTLRFTDTSTTNGPPITTWAWDFDDGYSASGMAATHTYMTNGVFNVRLTITDTCGYTATTTSVVTVTAPTLVASFVQSTVLAEIGATVYFTDTSTTDLPPIAAWTWDFGDNSSLVSTQNASHVYDTENTFTVTLTITDTLGYSDSYQSTVQVETGLEYIFLPLVLRNF
jgi:PKD repeat protein